MTVAKSKIVRPYAPDYVDVATLAYRLSVSESTIEKLVRTAKIPKARNVFGMLVPGGRFLVTTPFLLRVHDSPVDCSRWTETGLRYLLAEAGFGLDDTKTGSWGNRACVISNLGRWTRYRRWLHSLDNEPDYPVVVWALAKRPSEGDDLPEIS